ncbi:LptA/OstA family protein [uncultured Roseobacter sp.]|uniref:LptA/OstA family protein n=1 Tax=uncultured Roseobacter sp. TaxID=114847 RepID=UPI0026075CF8|nr:LptA/OstA family protein [uncultured Roseobacter sp.]
MNVSRLIAISLTVLVSATSLSAQGAQVAFGSLQQSKDLPVEVTADNLAVDQETGSAVFTDNVVISQGEMRLSAPRVLVVYKEETQGIERLEATGGVTLVSGEDAAESQVANYDIDNGSIVMTGDVLLVQGAAVLSADKMTVQLDEGTARMTGNIRTVLQTGEN